MAERDDAIRSFHDDIAPTYDERFAASGSGGWIRKKIQHRMLESFAPGDHILELNCGTGTDAIYLANHGIKVAATDVSPKMIETARRKLTALELDTHVSTAVMHINEIGVLRGQLFDGVVSNFNGLNYVTDLSSVAHNLAELVRPGRPVLLTLLNKICLWEVLYFLFRMNPARALRRITNRAKELNSRPYPIELQLYFPKKVAAIFSNGFLLRRITGFGLLMPPAGFPEMYKAYPRLLDKVSKLESRLMGFYPLYNLADHYLIELVRKGD